MLPSIHGFWLGYVLIVTVGTTSPTHFLINSVTVSMYASRFFSQATQKISQSIKTILKRGFRLVRPALNSTKHGYFLFEFLPIGREEQDGVVVRFAERKAGEGLVSIPEVGIEMVESLSSASSTVDMLIELRQPSPQICFVKIPSYNKCSLRICGFQFS
jgi:hypothetical protein